MAPISPDPPCGLRFCRDCQEFKPIGDFPAGKRRYQCRKHVEQRCKVSRTKACGSKRALARVWHAAYMDARAVFHTRTMKLSQADVAKLFAEGDVEPEVSFSVLPVDPKEVISADNVMLVSKGIEIVSGGPSGESSVCSRLGVVGLLRDGVAKLRDRLSRFQSVAAGVTPIMLDETSVMEAVAGDDLKRYNGTGEWMKESVDFIENSTNQAYEVFRAKSSIKAMMDGSAAVFLASSLATAERAIFILDRLAGYAGGGS